MPQPHAEKPRLVPMSGECVTCIDVSAQHMFWCSRSGGASTVYMWEFREEELSSVPLVELDFTPSHISSFEEKLFLVGDTMAALFMVERPMFAGIAAAEESEDEQITVTEEFVSDSIPADVTHIAWTPDGATVALSSYQGVLLIDCRVGFQDANCRDNEHWRLLTLNCTTWYGEPGAAFTAFGASSLFLLSTQNHLVMTRYSNNIETDVFCNVELQLERDGHIILRAHRVTCLAIGSGGDGPLVAGFSDGTVRLLHQKSLEVFFTLDVTKDLCRMSNTLSSGALGGDVYVLKVAVGCRFLLVVRSDAVALYDKRSMDLLEERTEFLSGDVPLLGACSGNGSWCVWSPQKEEFFYCRAVEEQPVGADTVGDLIHAHVPLPPRLLEPLRLPFQQQLSAAARPGGTNSKKSKKKKIVEKLVTFGHPIKSSGYASDVPWGVRQRQNKQIREKARHGVDPPRTMAMPLRYKAPPCFGHAFQPMSTANRILSSYRIHRAVVTEAVFSATGMALLTASGDTTANWLKYSVEKHKGKGTLMAAHTGPVNTADISLSIGAPIVATGSSDGVVALWQPLKQEAPYIMQNVGKEVRTVKFFYTDKFLSYAAGNSISLCRYALDDGGDDLHRKRNESQMELMLEFTPSSTQSIVALDCMNYFTSNLIVWAGSNKSVGIFDVSASRVIHVVEEAHARSIHRVAMMTASRYAAPSTNLLHMYLTAGLDNTVRLWDLRQQRCVRQLSLHRNSATPVGVAFSPNGSMVAVGSESREVCVYNVGAGTLVEKLAVGETPTAICWHPLEGVFALGTASGAIQLMKQC